MLFVIHNTLCIKHYFWGINVFDNHNIGSLKLPFVISMCNLRAPFEILLDLIGTLEILLQDVLNISSVQNVLNYILQTIYSTISISS